MSLVHAIAPPTQWTVADLSKTYRHAFQGQVYAISRQWTIWRIMAHDIHHGASWPSCSACRASAFPSWATWAGTSAGRPWPKRGQMALRRSDGREVVAAWKPQFLGMDVPQLVVDGRTVNVVEPLPWYVWVWSALPILLAVLGGALGALAGFIGFAINTRLFRSSLPGIAKFGLTAGVSLLAVVIYFGAGTLIYNALGR